MEWTDWSIFIAKVVGGTFYLMLVFRILVRLGADAYFESYLSFLAQRMGLEGASEVMRKAVADAMSPKAPQQTGHPAPTLVTTKTGKVN